MTKISKDIDTRTDLLAWNLVMDGKRGSIALLAPWQQIAEALDLPSDASTEQQLSVRSALALRIAYWIRKI